MNDEVLEAMKERAGFVMEMSEVKVTPVSLHEFDELTKQIIWLIIATSHRLGKNKRSYEQTMESLEGAMVAKCFLIAEVNQKEWTRKEKEELLPMLFNILPELEEQKKKKVESVLSFAALMDELLNKEGCDFTKVKG